MKDISLKGEIFSDPDGLHFKNIVQIGFRETFRFGCRKFSFRLFLWGNRFLMFVTGWLLWRFLDQEGLQLLPALVARQIMPQRKIKD